MYLLRPTSAVLCAALAAAPALAAEPADNPTRPLSFKACGAQYRAAKADGTLNGRKWLDYRRDVCRITAPFYRPAAAVVRSEAVRSEAVRRLEFPAALASEFSGETPWKARMRTCLKSYREAKQAGTLYGVRWVEKGGGYYSLCAARLRGAPKA